LSPRLSLPIVGVGTVPPPPEAKEEVNGEGVGSGPLPPPIACSSGRDMIGTARMCDANVPASIDCARDTGINAAVQRSTADPRSGVKRLIEIHVRLIS